MIGHRGDNIRTPWRQRLRRCRQGVLPLVSFILCVLLAVWLWRRPGQLRNSIGEVETVRIDVTATADGTLLALSPRLPELLERVAAGTVIARLDDAPTRAAMAITRARIAQLQSALRAAIEKAALTECDRQQAQRRESCRLTWEVQRRRLDVLDRRAVVETGRLEEKRLDAQVALLEPSLARGIVTELQVTQLRLERDEVRKRIAENERALVEAQEQADSAAAALRALPALRATSVDAVLAPVEAEIAVGERELDALQVQIDALEIRAPISGSICGIHRWPGQGVKAGEPIVTVAADRGRCIICYVRQEQPLRPAVGMPVVVQIHGSRTLPSESLVERVGAQVELLPLHHLRDPKTPEWGQPVWIQPPPQLDLRPGELVNVTFGPAS
jgi:multidrug resistance efflux pump